MWYRARAGLRARWGATVLLALLVGLIGGTVLTTISGARRSSSAYERYREETLAGDLDIAPSAPDPRSFEQVRRLPQVEAMTRTSYPFIVPAGSGLYPYLDFLALAPQDRAFGELVERPRLVDGRLADPARSDEVAVTELYAEEAGISVGDEIDFDSYAPDQVEALFDSGDAGGPAGPRVTLTVTGVVAAPILLSESVGSFSPRVILSVAFHRSWGDRMGVYQGGVTVRLRGGAGDVPEVVDAVRRIYADDAGLELQPAEEIGDKITDSLGAIVTGLLLCALCLGLTGVVVVGQAISRHLAQDAADLPTLAGLGMDARQRATTLWLAAVPIAISGGCLAVLGAAAASPLMPVGLAREAEPDPGLSFDGVVLGLGGIGTVALVLVLAGVAAWLVSRLGVTRGAAPGRRAPIAQRAAAQLSLPLPATIGIDMAFTPAGSGAPGRGRTGLVGVVLGVAGAVAAVVFAASSTALVSSPERFGFPWDAHVAGFTSDLADERGAELVADADVDDLAEMATSLARFGSGDVNVHAFETLKGEPDPTVLDGRMPTRPAEVALGTGTMGELGTEIGGTVEAAGSDGALELAVVGRVALPVVDDRSSVERGAVVVPETLLVLAPADSVNRDLVLRWAPGIDVRPANEALAERLQTEVIAARTPAEVNNLRRVETFPRVVALLLVAFAGTTATHVLVTSVRRRRRDLAVLRSLGFVRRQMTSIFVYQATTVALTGLLVGVPLGIVVGRAMWRVVAHAIGVLDAPDTPWLALAVAAGASVVVAGVAAAVPARMAKRAAPAAILRTG